MANYYLDCEFLEGTQKEKFPISLFRKETKPTIDLISIGIVSEDGREYYAISKDFNLKEAWNRYDLEPMSSKGGIGDSRHKKVYWIRENVLKPIYEELYNKLYKISDLEGHTIGGQTFLRNKFCYTDLKRLIKWYGKTNEEIAEEIQIFTTQYSNEVDEIWDKPKFYAYYADYDWVSFCWLFGKMIDLPNGFPMYCNDLKQELDEKAIKELDYTCWTTKEQVLEHIKTRIGFPKQENEHNALADARWNKKLHEFLNKIK